MRGKSEIEKERNEKRGGQSEMDWIKNGDREREKEGEKMLGVAASEYGREKKWTKKWLKLQKRTGQPIDVIHT